MSLPTLAILAGGTATRLRPITETIPKSLVEVAGEPFLAHQLRLAHEQGFRRVVLLIGHLGDQIRAFAGDGARFGLEVSYVEDGPVRRGTGGAVRAALPALGPAFFVLYGDSYLDIDAEPVWRAFTQSGCPALMTALHNADRWDASNVELRDGMVVRHDKMARGEPGVEWIDYGFSVFAAEALAGWPAADPFDLSELTGALARRGALAGFEVTQRFYEIGKPEGLAETEAYLRSRKRRK
jgi:NDP-sugar pyrophosphorylase family protein